MGVVWSLVVVSQYQRMWPTRHHSDLLRSAQCQSQTSQSQARPVTTPLRWQFFRFSAEFKAAAWWLGDTGGACKAIYHYGEERGTMAANPPQYFARAIHTSTEIIHAWLEFRPNSPTDWKCFVLFVLFKLTNIYTTIPSQIHSVWFDEKYVFLDSGKT